ncbi:hypothetical protein J22TS3_44820 [Paenibacillus sp. J22TS3]|nr:hypothetical protein J22TS3_44820 [Paenibacillus sp. J22TS3]
MILIIKENAEHLILELFSHKGVKSMRTAAAQNSQRIDEYLDLLNLATSLGDQKWQKEIIRKLSYMYEAKKEQ